MTNSFIISSLLMVAAVATAGGQQRSLTRLDTLHVGSAPLSAAYLRNDSSESVVLVPDTSATTGERVIGHLSERRRVLEQGTTALFRINHFSAPGNDVTDSIMTAAAGLVPIWETSHQTTKLMRLRFDGAHVTGAVTPTGKGSEAVDQQLAVAPFNSSDVFLLVGSLPLTSQYRALIATYEYESGGLRLDTLSVLGRERLSIGSTAHDTWVARVSRGGGSWMKVWIDADSRIALKEEFGSATRGWTLRLLRQ